MVSRTGFSKVWRFAVALPLATLLSGWYGCPGFFPGSNTIVSLAISPTGAFVMPNATQQFSATATFGNNSTGDVTSEVTWTSSSPTIATIDSSGLATGVALGTTTINAKSTNNVSATGVTLTVSNRTVQSITISPTSATINLSLGQQTTAQFVATATFSDGSTTSQVNWASSNNGVATVNSSGLATAVTTGSCTITASLGGQTAAASLTVQ